MKKNITLIQPVPVEPVEFGVLFHEKYYEAKKYAEQQMAEALGVDLETLRQGQRRSNEIWVANQAEALARQLMQRRLDEVLVEVFMRIKKHLVAQLDELQALPFSQRYDRANMKYQSRVASEIDRLVVLAEEYGIDLDEKKEDK